MRTNLGVKTAVLSIVLLLSAAAAGGAVSPQRALAGSSIPAFAQQLPTLTTQPGGTITTIAGNQPLTLRMCEFRANMLPPGTIPGYAGTKVWGYIAGDCPTTTLETYIGPVIVNRRGSPTTITYVNELGSAATTEVLAYRYSTDQTLHWADPFMEMCSGHMGHAMAPAFGSPCAQNYEGPIPAVAHLHGGEVPAEIDGSPDSWFTSDGAYRGTKYYSQPGAAPNAAIYQYPNLQEAAPLWFHDHTLGATRLNVYAGLAGAYFIHDPALNLPANLQPLTAVVPLVIQDRMFDTNGELLFTAGIAGGTHWALNPEHPYWNPEFVGDTIVVNGKVWPNLDVEPKRYRFLLLNGSNARTYELSLTDAVTKKEGPSLHVIGTDGGYLDAPVTIDPAATGRERQKLVIMPGERYEVIVDFSTVAPGSRLFLKNVARTPFPFGEPPKGGLGKVMQFTVGPCTSGRCGAADSSYDPASGAALRAGSQAIKRLADPASGTLASGVVASRTRQLTLNEVMAMEMTATNPITGELTEYEGGPLEILVNNTTWAGTITETPLEGATEIWELVNMTADAHPIHLHLVQFQLINRQNFSLSKYEEVYEESFPGDEYEPAMGPPLPYDAAANPLSGGKDGGNPDVTPYLRRAIEPPLPNEAGWKDTVVVHPGQVTRLAVRWAPTDLPIATPVEDLHFPFDPSGAGGQFNYVWHCHIIDHEDNEMMRPDLVLLNPAAPVPASRLLVKGVDY
ncbi:MAG TPA: multicopper oxidase [Thermoanaerobaculia bacterium]|nr:multicopper oxidase [Thermoanaerobaculia bacterium]